MTDPKPESPDGKTATDAAKRALDGTDVGSDTRAGSLEGGSATGSEHDEAQAASDRHLAELGPGLKAAGQTPSSPPRGEPPKGVTNTGHPADASDSPGDNADAATG